MANFPRRFYPDYAGAPQAPGLSYAPYRSQYPPMPTDSGYPLTRPMYRTEYPPVETTVGASQVEQAAPKTSDQSDQIINKRYKYLGYALVFLSLAILALEIANVAFTYVTFAVNTTTYVKKAFAAPYILTWVAPGIWGAIIVFITGYLAVRVAGQYNNLVRIFALFCSLSAIVFTPAIFSISIAELVMYPTYPTGDSQPMYNSYACYNFNNPSSLSCPKFVLPLIVAILSGIAFYLTLMVTVILCCCWNPEGVTTSEVETTQVIDEYYPYARYPPYAPVNNQMMRLPPAQPYAAEVPGYRVAPRMVEPDMDFLRQYPIYRPAASRGFGFASAYNRQSYGNFPGTLPSLTSFGNSDPNPAYRVVYA